MRPEFSDVRVRGSHSRFLKFRISFLRFKIQVGSDESLVQESPQGFVVQFIRWNLQINEHLLGLKEEARGPMPTFFQVILYVFIV